MICLSIKFIYYKNRRLEFQHQSLNGHFANCRSSLSNNIFGSGSCIEIFVGLNSQKGEIWGFFSKLNSKFSETIVCTFSINGSIYIFQLENGYSNITCWLLGFFPQRKPGRRKLPKIGYSYDSSWFKLFSKQPQGSLWWWSQSTVS